MRRRIVAAVIVAAGLATAGIAYAENQPADPSVTPTPSAAEAKAGLRGGPLKGAIHGDLLIMAEDGSTRTVTFDRGKVTAISGPSITIERPDGVSVSKTLTDRTVFNGTSRDQLQPGAAVVVVSSGDTAERVLSKGDRPEKRLERKKERTERRKEQIERRKQWLERERLEPSAAVDDGLETILS